MSLYSQDEKKRILNYIVERNAFHLIKGDKIWKDLAETGQLSRTWQSMKQHFRKRMIHELHYPIYGLTTEQVQQFRDHFNKELPKKGSNKAPVAEVQPPPGRRFARITDTFSSSSDDSDD